MYPRHSCVTTTVSGILSFQIVVFYVLLVCHTPEYGKIDERELYLEVTNYWSDLRFVCFFLFFPTVFLLFVRYKEYSGLIYCLNSFLLWNTFIEGIQNPLST